MEDLDKAAVLAEALPFIREFAGTTVVIKYGGNAMGREPTDAEVEPGAAGAATSGKREPASAASAASAAPDPGLADLFAQDVVIMRLVGMNPVVVHGGGPQISDLMQRLGKEPEFVDGLRVTDADTVDIARMALVGRVNRDIVTAINRHGPFAVGLSGEDAGLLTVEQRDERLGFVGDVTEVRPGIVRDLTLDERIPVIATIGLDADGRPHNVNADDVAAAIAQALEAEKLVYLTNVAGIYRDFADKESLVSEIDVAGLEALVDSGALNEGMIPKVRSCLDALRGGVGRAHILDGRTPHVLLLEFFTRAGVGTMVRP